MFACKYICTVCKHVNVHTYRQTDTTGYQYNLKENVDQRKINLVWCCHLHHQPHSQGFLQELSNRHSLDLSNLTLLLLLLNKL